jgi:hypothetical protein
MRPAGRKPFTRQSQDVLYAIALATHLEVRKRGDTQFLARRFCKVYSGAPFCIERGGALRGGQMVGGAQPDEGR